MEQMYTVFAGAEREKFEVPKSVLEHSKCIVNMMEDTEDTQIPFENIDPKTMSLILEFCKYLTEKNKAARDYTNDRQTSAEEKEKKKEETETKQSEYEDAFMKDLDTQKKLFDVTLATNFLNIDHLLDVCCKYIARKITGKTIEEIRQEFGIVNDFTPEEEEHIRRENAWMFESM